MSVPETPWDRLYGDVKISIPGVVDAVYAQELFRCVKDFFDCTNIWQETVPITAVPNTTEYPFTLAGEGTPNRLMILYDPAISTNPNNRQWVQAGAGMQVPGTISIAYAPSTSTQWEAVVAKNVIEVNDDNQPLIDEEDHWIIDKYRDALCYGTLARLQRAPGKTYSSPQLAADNMRQYIALRARARVDTQRKNVFGAQSWTFPQGFATVGRKGWV